jgi:hypothetical protein
VYLAHVVSPNSPTFIEIGEDDLPVTPVPAPVAPPQMTSGQVHRGGAPRTSEQPDADLQRAANKRADDKRYGREIVVPSAATAPDTIPEDVITDQDDLAAVVVKKTLKQMAAGKVTPTLRDGLQAQQLLDRRAEKAADRSFMLNLAMAMAGGGIRTPVKYLPAPNEPDPDIIEGDFVEQNLAPDHLRQA